MVVDQTQPRTQRLCFVTIGATAKFDSLIAVALNSSFLQALQASDYTDLVLQHGNEGGRIYNDFITANPVGSGGRCGLEISGFDFKGQGLGKEMRAAKGGNGRAEGLVISHAGLLPRSTFPA